MQGFELSHGPMISRHDADVATGARNQHV